MKLVDLAHHGRDGILETKLPVFRDAGCRQCLSTRQHHRASSDHAPHQRQQANCKPHVRPAPNKIVFSSPRLSLEGPGMLCAVN